MNLVKPGPEYAMNIPKSYDEIMFCNSFGGMAKSKNLRVKKIKIIGLIQSYAFQCAKYFAEELHRSLPLMFPAPDIIGLLELEWHETVTDWRRVSWA